MSKTVAPASTAATPSQRRPPVGAGMPANTGAAGARHRVACFAGLPAPRG
ncbi:diguanylate cyclase [Pseudomonas sp. CAH-1]|nr:diguanylate cyclase [Pseudomonas sp. CAH-1]